MLSKLQILLFCLTALAVGAIQVFGVQAGYVCACTGQRSVEIKCQPEECHPEKAEDCGQNSAASGKVVSHEATQNGDTPSKDGHRHLEVRDELHVTAFQPITALPSAIFFILPPAFQAPELAALTALTPGITNPEPPEYGSPPMPQLVARTIVMLV